MAATAFCSPGSSPTSVIPAKAGTQAGLGIARGTDLDRVRGDSSMTLPKLSTKAIAALIAVALLPLLVRVLFPSSERYYLHLLIQILLWSFIYTGWSLMGRFGLTSLGHGAFTGIGAYVTVLLWNYAGISPWLGIPVAVLMSTIVGVLIGYPCFNLRITGHYFGLLTLALTEFVRLVIVGLRDYTGGSLGTQPKRYGDGLSLYAMQFEPDRMLSFYVAFLLWLFGLYVWWRVDQSMDRYALDAASQDEDAAASVGINVTREKLKITALSAAMCALGGAIFGQYQMYIGPDTIAGLGTSLNMVFAVVSGGMWVMLGPTVGAVFTQVLSEGLRVAIQSSAGLKSLLGSAALALDSAIYGLLLILFIIYMPKGILGTILERRSAAKSKAT
jgi:branched-chain amino acid transport system permease protein